MGGTCRYASAGRGRRRRIVLTYSRTPSAMLPVKRRVRTATDFTHTVRSGARSGRRNVLLYGVGTTGTSPSRAGFIVGKGVGNAVTRNLVRRQLRHAVAEQLRSYPYGYDFVVRALPASGTSNWSSLQADVAGGLATVTRKLGQPDPAGRAGDGRTGRVS